MRIDRGRLSNTFLGKTEAAVAHKEFKEWKNLKWKSLVIKNGIIYDLKNIVPKDISTIRL